MASEPDHRLKVAQVVPCTEAEGPGLRFAIWLQGCPLRCPGCCNPQMLPVEGGEEVPVAGFSGRSARRPREIEGITLLGGEPTTQADGAAEPGRAGPGGRAFRSWSSAGSRWRSSEARATRPSSTSSAGPTSWSTARISGIGPSAAAWIGSANQRVHALTDRYRVDDPCWLRPNTLEVRLRGRGDRQRLPRPVGGRALATARRRAGGGP